MKITITRAASTPDGTPGRLVTEEGFSCDTLELPWNGNKNLISCIRADTYLGHVWQSPTMGRPVVRLEDKHGRTNVLIHNGNFAGDPTIDEDQDGKSDKLAQVKGCTEVGMGYGMIDRPDGHGLQWGVLSSKPTLAALIAHLGPGNHEFVYQWSPGCSPEGEAS